MSHDCLKIYFLAFGPRGLGIRFPTTQRPNDLISVLVQLHLAAKRAEQVDEHPIARYLVSSMSEHLARYRNAEVNSTSFGDAEELQADA